MILAMVNVLVKCLEGYWEEAETNSLRMFQPPSAASFIPISDKEISAYPCLATASRRSERNNIQ